MTKVTALKIASTVLLSLAAFGAAQTAGARESSAADTYGYTFRSHDVYTGGARNGKLDTFTEGTRGKADSFTDGARVAGLDRVGVSAAPARSFDPYSDGARSGKLDPFSEGANA